MLHAAIVSLGSKALTQVSLTFCAVKEYVKGLSNADELLDMISAALEDQEAKASRGEMLYPEVGP